MDQVAMERGMRFAKQKYEKKMKEKTCRKNALRKRVEYFRIFPSLFPWLLFVCWRVHVYKKNSG